MQRELLKEADDDGTGWGWTEKNPLKVTEEIQEIPLAKRCIICDREPMSDDATEGICITCREKAMTVHSRIRWIKLLNTARATVQVYDETYRFGDLCRDLSLNAHVGGILMKRLEREGVVGQPRQATDHGKSLCVRCNKRPIAVKSRDLCQPCAQQEYHEHYLDRVEREHAAEITRLMPLARELVRRREGSGPTSILTSELNIQQSGITLVLQRHLKREGLLVARKGIRAHRVTDPPTVLAVDKVSMSPSFTLAEQRQGIERLLGFMIQLRGDEGEYENLLRAVVVTLDEHSRLLENKALLSRIKEELNRADI